MTRNLRALGLAVSAVLALSAVVASSASAATFHSESTPTILTGTSTAVGHNPHQFISGEATISCTTVTFTGTVVGDAGGPTATTISLRPTFANCTFLGEPASIDTTGCTFVIQSHTNGTGHLPTTLDCTGANAITVTSGACSLKYGSQLATGGTTPTNLGAGSTADETIHITLSATFTKSGPLCFLVAGNIGSYSGTSTLQGFKEGSVTGNLHENNYVVHEGAQVGISWS